MAITLTPFTCPSHTNKIPEGFQSRSFLPETVLKASERTGLQAQGERERERERERGQSEGDRSTHYLPTKLFPEPK